jgi:23S rRNA U2552 (ribose-2'-O)-methylase RlmE/FtsJ
MIIMYKPFVFDLPNGKYDFLDKIDPNNEKNILISSYINQPLFSLGFHSFIHRTKNAMSITNNLETKNKFYYVVNPFEQVVTDYKDSVFNKTKEYFNSKDEPAILSRAFYKMWEMLILFNLADSNNLTYAALAEGPGSFLQAIIKYREKFGYNIKTDNIYSVTIHSEKGKYIEMGKQFLGYYNQLYPDLIMPHKTFTKNTASKFKGKDNGDITQVKTIGLFKKDLSKAKKLADLVTADGGFPWDDENYQEQEAYQLILGEIIAALRVQAKGGHFVLKIFESFTMITLKMIYILTAFYEEAYLYKPFFSRDSNSEKYIICKNFKFDQNKDSKQLDHKLKVLEQILEKMNTTLFINDILPDMEIPRDFINKMKYINIQIANTQQVIINQIIKYIKGNNYFGDLYHTYNGQQIKANQWWIESFYLDKKAIQDSNLSKMIETSINYNNSEINLFNKQFL